MQVQVQNIHSKDKFLSNNIYDIIIENKNNNNDGNNNDDNNNDGNDDIHNNINSTINESNSFKNIFITNKNKFINMAKFLSNDTTCNMMFFSKTQMCKNNICVFGDKCKFAHSYNELVCQTTLPCLYGPYCIIDSCQRKHFSFNDTKLLHENIYNKISKVKLNLKNDLKKQNLFNNNLYLKDFNLEGIKSYDLKNKDIKVPKLNLNEERVLDEMESIHTINRERKRFINSNFIKGEKNNQIRKDSLFKDKSPLNTTSTTPTNISPRERDEKKYILLKEFLKKNSTYKSNHSNKDDIYNDTIIYKTDYDYP